MAKRRNARQRQKKRQARRQRQPRDFCSLSPCAQLYARAIEDPWGTEAGACVPDSAYQGYSRRVKCWVRGSAVVGSSGVAFVAANPFGFIANDYVGCTFSNSNYASSVLEADTTVVGVDGSASNSPYDAAGFGDVLAAYRIVAGGLRWKYSGTQLNMGGTSYALYSGFLNSDLDQLGAAGMAKFQECVPLPVDRKWRKVLTYPSEDTNLQFSIAPSGSATALSRVHIALLATGVTAGETFQFEGVFHYEVAGATSGKIPSSADPIGMAAVTSGVMKSLLGDGERSVIEYAKQALKDGSMTALQAGTAALTL